MSARLLAISDLHVNHRGNLAALEAMPRQPGSWLIVAGDVGDKLAHVAAGLDVLLARFERVIWVPGNHELWRLGEPDLGGVARYEALVDLCRVRGVLTPEDPWSTWTGAGGPALIVPVFVGYDYSWAPPELAPRELMDWAGESGIRPVDNRLLDTAPFADVVAWCVDRVAQTEARLATLGARADRPTGTKVVLVNHYPLRRELCRIPLVPRYTPWCGTQATRDWHTRFGLDIVVSGHLHVRATDWQDGTRFEEVSLGYPRHWKAERGAAGYLRDLLRPEPVPPGGQAGPEFKRWR